MKHDKHSTHEIHFLCERHNCVILCIWVIIILQLISENNNTSFWCLFYEVNKIFSGFDFNYYGNHCESNVYALGSDSNSGVQSYTLTI